ncbi:MAG: right-handed parallel beta-helix repeat-containing protein [Burkholderiaceae bacterium]|nr:MAG: right-handed parallel beta-helix repeat-containing protein [Burkholderiaceae bacterium]
MRRWLAVILLSSGALIIAGMVLIETVHIAPRLAAHYLTERQYRSVWLARAGYTLLALDRGAPPTTVQYPDWIARWQTAHQPSPAQPGQRHISVNTAEQARAALAAAEAGDIIEFQPGHYRFDGSNIPASSAGREDAPIIVRAAQPGTVELELATEEGFWVQGPYWQFENLTVRGICKEDHDCEHAFHVVGGAHHFVARNNTLIDFNAHFKINGAQGQFPDHGRIEGNRLSNEHPRRTDRSVTLIDLVAASDWVIEKNLIADFVKQRGDHTSYGVFAKGGGARNQIRSNVILCTVLLRNPAFSQDSRQVGASLGGGGSSANACRDKKCVVEQEDGVISNNLIAGCSDEGIYLNRAARSAVHHNTLLDTAGVSLRYAVTSADMRGNLIDGPLRLRDGAVLHDADNRSNWVTGQYLGLHRVRDLFADAAQLDLRWRGAPPRQAAASTDEAIDLCGQPRPAQPAYGAFEDFAACNKQ